MPTATFKVLYCFVVLSLDRRRIVHINITSHPTAAWTARQLLEAFPMDTAPRFLMRDRDSIYGWEVARAITSLSITEVISTPRSPWRNPFVERVIGSIRRECTDHVIPMGESHLRRVLNEYATYYNESRTHQSLGGNAPEPRGVQAVGQLIAEPVLGGLHHRYSRAA
jgi:transposase InsO family protein